MTEQSKDRIEGTIDETTGRGKSAWGELTDDPETKAEGDADQVAGRLKQGMADVKDKIDDAVKRITSDN